MNTTTQENINVKAGPVLHSIIINTTVKKMMNRLYRNCSACEGTVI